MHADRKTPEGSGYAGRDVTKPPPWHSLVAFDMLFNNLSSGLFLVVFCCELAFPDVFARPAPIAHYLCLGFLLADLVCLVLDLGDPLRFHHMLRVVKLTSPMSLGTWCLTLYSFPLTLVVLLDVLAAFGVYTPPRWAYVLVLALDVLPALGVMGYKGVLFSTTAQPGWRDARWLGGYLAVSAFTLGASVLLLIALCTGEPQAVQLSRNAMGGLLLLSTIPMGLLVAETAPEFRRRFSPGRIAVGAFLGMVLGMLAPLCLLPLGGVVPLVLAASFRIFGALVWRYDLVFLPQAQL